MTDRTRLLYLLLIVALIVIAGLALSASAASSATVTIEWSTASELNTAGFNLNRGDNQDGPFTRLNSDLIPASPDPLVGGSYVYTDTAVIAGRIYYYQLEEVETSGAATAQGVVAVTADGGLNPTVLAALAAGVIVPLGLMVFLRRKRPNQL